MGVVNESPSLVRVNCRRTRSVPPSRSTSSLRKPRSSPCADYRTRRRGDHGPLRPVRRGNPREFVEIEPGGRHDAYSGVCKVRTRGGATPTKGLCGSRHPIAVQVQYNYPRRGLRGGGSRLMKPTDALSQRCTSEPKATVFAYLVSPRPAAVLPAASAGNGAHSAASRASPLPVAAPPSPFAPHSAGKQPRALHLPPAVQPGSPKQVPSSC